MKQIYNVYTLIPWLILISNPIKADTIFVASTIESATVYYQGAEINRTSTLSVPKGQHVLVFDHLPYEISEEEYQLKASHSEMIVSLNLNKKRGKLRGKSEETKRLEEEIEDLIDESKDIEERAFILDTKKKVLLSNSQIHANDEAVNLAELEKAMQYFDNKLNDIRKERLKLKERLGEIEDEIKDRNTRIQNSISKANKNYAQITVHIDNSQNREAELTLSYFLPSASWRPIYNVKVDEINTPLLLEFQAEVFQTTGEDWNDVTLKLSDSKLTKANDFPVFEPWYLEQPRPVKEKDISYTTLEGVVGDVSSGDILPNSEIEILKNKKTFKRIVTDKYGAFKVNPIPAGHYSLIIKNKGFYTITQNIYLSTYKNQFLEIGLNDQKTALITKAEISAKPVRGVAGLVAQSAGMYQSDLGTIIKVNGGRSDQTVYFVDGVKTMGTPNLSNRADSKYKERVHIQNQVNEEQLTTQYELKSPHDILSNGEEYTLRIKTVEIPAEYEYMVFAREEPAAYLKGKIVDITQYNLFTGQANIYFQGQYVGQTILDTKHVSDTMSLFLGKDKDIVVERKQFTKVNSNTFMINGKTRSDLDVNVIVKNKKHQPVNLVVVEQYPITKHKEVAIALSEYEGASHDEKTGKLEWKLTLNPGQEHEFNYKYSTKHPDYIHVN